MPEQEANTLALIIISGLFTVLWWFIRVSLIALKEDLREAREQIIVERDEIRAEITRKGNENVQLRTDHAQLRNEWLEKHGQVLATLSEYNVRLLDMRDRHVDYVLRLRQLEADFARFREDTIAQRRQTQRDRQ